jgi:hypothetical protein
MKGMKMKKAVVVTTAHRGVFFGYIDEKTATDKPTIKLNNARLCLYWSSNVKGFMGLAVTGPTKGCRIGPEAKSITLQAITSVLEVSKEAVKAWESAPWN